MFFDAKSKSSPISAVPANIRLCWKSLPGTNALAYHKKS